MTDITVTFNDASSRYEIAVDGAVAGFAQVTRDGERIIFTHTEVDEAYLGQGLATTLAKEALADAVSRDAIIVPLCPFISRYVTRHPIDGARIESSPSGR